MIELLVLVGTFALAGWTATTHAHRRLTASRALEGYARSRGLVFVPAPRRPRGASPRVLGSGNEVPWEVDLFRLDGAMRTRVTAHARSGRSPEVSVLQRASFDVAAKHAIVTGDETFDRAYAVTSGTPRDVDALRDAMSPLLLLAQRVDELWLRAGGSKVALSWRGAEERPPIVDAARDVVVHLAMQHREETPYR